VGEPVLVGHVKSDHDVVTNAQRTQTRPDTNTETYAQGGWGVADFLSSYFKFFLLCVFFVS